MVKKTKPVERKFDRTYKLDNFFQVVPDTTIKQVMTKRDYKRFWKWMYGQTVTRLGGETFIFVYDLERYLRGGQCID